MTGRSAVGWTRVIRQNPTVKAPCGDQEQWLGDEGDGWVLYPGCEHAPKVELKAVLNPWSVHFAFSPFLVRSTANSNSV